MNRCTNPGMGSTKTGKTEGKTGEVPGFWAVVAFQSGSLYSLCR
jgi:hypothetical protein